MYVCVYTYTYVCVQYICMYIYLCVYICRRERVVQIGQNYEVYETII